MHRLLHKAALLPTRQWPAKTFGVAQGTVLLFLGHGLQGCEAQAAPHLGHEREELVEQAGHERLDGVQVVRVEGVHQVAQRRHRVHAHLRATQQGFKEGAHRQHRFKAMEGVYKRP